MKLPKPENIKNIVWIQTSFLGDIILSTGAINLAAQTFSDAKQIVITTALGAKALVGEDYIQTQLIFTKRGGSQLLAMLNIRKQLAKLNCQKNNSVVLVPHRSLRSTLLSRIIGLPTIGYDEGAASSLYTVRCPRIAVLHECHRIALLLEPLGVSRELVLSTRPTLRAAELRTSTMPSAGKCLAIAPGSKWGTKMWPKENFSKLIERVLNETNLHVLILGSSEERLLSQEITDQLPHSAQARISNLTGTTSLDDLRGIYPRLLAIVTNDSSPLHYASAFNVPTVAIFGATTSCMGFGPLATAQQIVDNPGLSCRPCSDHGPQICPAGHFRCMRDISVSQVWRSLKQLIEF